MGLQERGVREKEEKQDRTQAGRERQNGRWKDKVDGALTQDGRSPRMGCAKGG
jgi:hypothetical protein